MFNNALRDINVDIGNRIAALVEFYISFDELIFCNIKYF